MIELSGGMTTALLVSTGSLTAILVAIILLRPRVFTSYLAHMTGIRLSSKDVSRVFSSKGQAGVRDMFLELIIREDLKNGPRITPDSPPDRDLLIPEERT